MLQITNCDLRKVYAMAFGIALSSVGLSWGVHSGLDLDPNSLGSLLVEAMILFSAFALFCQVIQREVQTHSNILNHIVDEISDVIVVKDYDGNFVFCNQKVGELYGAKPKEMVGKDDFDYTGNREQADFFRQNVREVMDGETTQEVLETSTDSNSGKNRYFKSIKIPFKDAQGQSKITVIAKDITDLVELREEADRNKKRLEHVLDVSEEGLWEWNTQTNEVHHNDHWLSITGIEKSENTFSEFESCILEEDRPLIHNALQGLMEQNEPYSIEFRMRRPDGRIIWMWDRGRVAEVGEDGKAHMVVGIVLDITEQKLNQEKIINLAYYDQLTGLYNRAQMELELEDALNKGAENNQYSAVLFLDLDRFKLLNDSYGHHMGDNLLKTIAERLQKVDTTKSIISRFGGDEFVMVLPELNHNQTLAFAKAEFFAKRVIDSISQVLLLESDVQDVELKYSITGSIGGIIFKNNNITPGKLIQLADLALYRAKAKGGNSVMLCNTDMQDELEHASALQKTMHDSVLNDDFVIHLQPKYNAQQSIIGAEALVRWSHPTLGLLAPNEFIQIAEETNMIIAIGNQVLQQACQQLERWQQHDETKELHIAVNLSAKQIWQSYFVDDFIRLTQQYNIDRTKLIVEVTESVLIQDLNDATVKLTQLKEYGVSISLDDFGTGYSSLSYLRSLPIDELKIDREFVRDIDTDHQAYLVVKSIIDLARNFNLKVVSEGVETKAQFNLLKDHDVHHYQGFYFSKPVTRADFMELFIDHLGEQQLEFEYEMFESF